MEIATIWGKRVSVGQQGSEKVSVCDMPEKGSARDIGAHASDVGARADESCWRECSLQGVGTGFGHRLVLHAHRMRGAFLDSQIA